MTLFATYLHSQTAETSKPVETITFTGFSYPYFSKTRHELASRLNGYPHLSVRKADYRDFSSVHIQTYLDSLALMANDTPPVERPKLGNGCQGLEYCLPGYTYGLGGMMEAIDQMKQGHLERAYCFSLGGHHAYADWGHGYCILHSQAAVTRYAQAQGLKRVLIIDWDIHHGDGTQSIFAHDPTVYCISLHSMADLYMSLACGLRYGTTTEGEELGHCNIPILHQSYADNFFEQLNLPGKFYRGTESLAVFQQTLEQLPWTPDIIFIHSGYDGHKDDCGANITNWTNADFQQMTRYVVELSKKAGSPILSVHGGGYNPPVTISAAISHVEVLARA